MDAKRYLTTTRLSSVVRRPLTKKIIHKIKSACFFLSDLREKNQTLILRKLKPKKNLRGTRRFKLGEEGLGFRSSSFCFCCLFFVFVFFPPARARAPGPDPDGERVVSAAHIAVQVSPQAAPPRAPGLPRRPQRPRDGPHHVQRHANGAPKAHPNPRGGPQGPAYGSRLGLFRRQGMSVRHSECTHPRP